MLSTDVEVLEDRFLGVPEKNIDFSVFGDQAYRVCQHDEEFMTMDYDLSRVNLKLDVDGVVVKVWLG